MKELEKASQGKEDTKAAYDTHFTDSKINQSQSN
jgi:hypothetical protein